MDNDDDLAEYSAAIGAIDWSTDTIIATGNLPPIKVYKVYPARDIGSNHLKLKHVECLSCGNEKHYALMYRGAIRGAERSPTGNYVILLKALVPGIIGGWRSASDIKKHRSV